MVHNFAIGGKGGKSKANNVATASSCEGERDDQRRDNGIPKVATFNEVVSHKRGGLTNREYGSLRNHGVEKSAIYNIMKFVVVQQPETDASIETMQLLQQISQILDLKIKEGR